MRPLPAKTLLLTILFTAFTFQAALPEAVPQAKQRTAPDSQLLNATREITVPATTADSGTAAIISEKVSPVLADKNYSYRELQGLPGSGYQ